MPPLTVTNAALARFIWTSSGIPYAVNVLGAQNPSGTGVTQGTANSLSAAVKSALTSSGLGAFISTAVTLSQVTLRNINVANQAELIGTGAAAAGTSAGDMLPPQISLCVTLRTALAGRSFRGRIYLPGFTEAASEPPGGTVPAGVATAATAFMTAVISAFATAGLPMAIVSRPDPDRVPPSAGFVTPVTVAVVRDLIWDNQRRRAVPGI